MIRKISIPVFSLLAGASMAAEVPKVLEIGASLPPFSLPGTDGKTHTEKDYADAKIFCVIFTCNHCPYAVKYEQRIIDLDKKYKALGFPVIAINPNDSTVVPEDSYGKMQSRAKEKGYTFPYLYDQTQQVARSYGAMKTPHIYLLAREKGKLVVKYVGAIDNNYEDASKADRKFVEEAIAEIQAGKAVTITGTKAVGCSIKWKP
jgi:peroxiredoxin